MSLYLGTYPLVPGLPARWWAKAMFTFLAITQTLGVAIFLVGLVLFRENLFAFIIVAVALLAAGTIATIATGLLGLPNSKREVAAGYTTLGGAHQELDQVDPATGRVIRRAGEPYLRERSRLARFTPLVVLVVVILLTCFLAVTALTGTGRGQAKAIGGLVGLVIGGLCLGAYAFYLRSATKKNTSAAGLRYPTAQLFACVRNPDLMYELRLADDEFAERDASRKFPRAFVLAIDGSGLHLVAAGWGEPVTVTWSRVTSIRHGWVKEGRKETLAADVVLGDEYVLPFTIALPTTFSDRDTPTDALLAELTDGLERASRR